MISYYNIDDILAEEETVTCTALFDYSYLGHLDPDYVTPRSSPSSVMDNENRVRKVRKRGSYLAENTRIKMPLWSIEKWIRLGFARMSIPRHFGRKMRERLETDPGSADLRSKNERFFKSGLRLVNLLQETGDVLPAKALTANKSRRRIHISIMKEVLQETKQLRKTLLATYTGERLRRTFDWALGSIGDDVSLYTSRLSEMELNLFVKGACASASHTEWKNYGSRRILVSSATLATTSSVSSSSMIREQATKITPDKDLNNIEARKRQRVI